MSAAFLFSYPSFFVLFLYFIPVAEMKEKLKNTHSQPCVFSYAKVVNSGVTFVIRV